ncbi:MAG TPA: hypothetical protein VNK96_06555 [Fimbriimonadales bacterium]|nr:hypothetical protein [Fimbriimonadales bacterium]
MTLFVEFPEFLRAVKMFGGEPTACCLMLKAIRDSVHLTYADPKSGVHVSSFCVGTEDEVTAKLKAEGFETMRGMWVSEASLEHLAKLSGETYVAAVAYTTKAGPGLWMDAYPTPPSEGTVLRTIFEEFVAEGYLGENEFERFLEEGNPTVRILGPLEIEKFLKQKQTA